MSEILRKVEAMECDYHRTLPPKLLLEHTLSAVLEKMIAAGGSRQRLFETTGAVWMLSHARFQQYFPLYPGDVLRYNISPRVMEGAHYRLCAEANVGDRKALDFAFGIIPVQTADRHVLRLEQAEPIWTTQAITDTNEPLTRLRPDCEFSPCGCDTVRMSDCDINHHMTSGAYAALACDALDFWGGSETRYMKQMQIDYCSEVKPGTTLSFERGEAENAVFLRALKPDGKKAFIARCCYD